MNWSNKPTIKVVLVTTHRLVKCLHSAVHQLLFFFRPRERSLAYYLSPGTFEKYREALTVSLGLHFLWHPRLAYTCHFVGGRSWLYGNTFDLIPIALRRMKTAMHKRMDTGVSLRIRRSFPSTRSDLTVIGMLVRGEWLALDGPTLVLCYT